MKIVEKNNYKFFIIISEQLERISHTGMRPLFYHPAGIYASHCANAFPWSL